MRWQDHILVDPGVCHGKPCFKGTRIMVATILDNLAAAKPEAEILRKYPSLPQGAIQAALAYAADLANERVLDLPA